MTNHARLINSEWCNTSGIHVRRKTLKSYCSVHGHDFYELDVVLNGRAATHLNGHDHTAESGTVFFLTPEDFHDYPEGKPLEFYNVHFIEDAVSSDLLQRLSISKNRLFKPSPERFALLCTFIDAMLEEQDEELLCRLLECVLLLLCKTIGEKNAPLTKGEPLQKAVLYIHAHFRENPSLGEVASLLPLNERYFCKLFRAYTGKSYKNYLRELKLRYARRMILFTDRPMIEIALESGYGTQSHFNREFREHYALTPLEMRKQMKKTQTAEK